MKQWFDSPSGFCLWESNGRVLQDRAGRIQAQITKGHTYLIERKEQD